MQLPKLSEKYIKRIQIDFILNMQIIPQKSTKPTTMKFPLIIAMRVIWSRLSDLIALANLSSVSPH